MFATNHALVGAALGALIDSPVKAAAAGVVSHAVMDAIPHWGVADRHGNARDKRIFYAVAVTDGLALAAVGVGLLKHRSLPMLAGAAGGVLPDLDKPAELIGVQLWPDAVNRVHAGIQWAEKPRHWPVEAVAAVAGLFAVRRLRSRRA